MNTNEVINCVREHLDKWYASNNHNETAIQLVNEYEERIRADERRKFAEWLCENNAGIVDFENEEWKIKTVYRGADFAINEYEKEQKNENK